MGWANHPDPAVAEACVAGAVGKVAGESEGVVAWTRPRGEPGGEDAPPRVEVQPAEAAGVVGEVVERLDPEPPWSKAPVRPTVGLEAAEQEAL